MQMTQGVLADLRYARPPFVRPCESGNRGTIMRIQHSLPLLVLLSAAGIGCSDDSPTAPPPVPGSVSGRAAFDSLGGYPMQHVLVTVEGKISWTGLDGMYLIEGVTPGNQELIASRWDHLVHVDTISITSGQLTTYDIVLVLPTQTEVLASRDPEREKVEF